MPGTQFDYVTYVAAPTRKVWEALIKAESTRKYWGHENVSDWKRGSAWEHRDAGNGMLRLTGKVVEFEPPRRMVLTWADPAQAGDHAAHSRVAIELEPIEDMTRLSVRHDRLVPGSEMQRGIEEGWPRVLSSLKSYLETGKPLPTWAKAAR